jgi:Tfp pilus assembly protein PilX
MKENMKPFRNEDGVVLVMVLLVLMATIVIGIFLARTSFIETKIAGNESKYMKNLYIAESATDWTMLNSSAALASIGLTINGNYTYSTASYTGAGEISDATINVRLRTISRPPLGSGNDPARFRARYYNIRASRQGQTVTVGAYKVFPKS